MLLRPFTSWASAGLEAIVILDPCAAQKATTCLVFMTRVYVPGFLMSGDVDPDCLRKARDSGYQLQHKPIDPMVLRAMCAHLLKTEQVARARETGVH